MEMLFGALGALAVLALLALGAAAGWLARARLYRTETRAPDRDELERLHAQQEAFRQMQSYSAEAAYGVDTPLEQRCVP